jgi:hypothetical protein
MKATNTRLGEIADLSGSHYCYKLWDPGHYDIGCTHCDLESGQEYEELSLPLFNGNGESWSRPIQ